MTALKCDLCGGKLVMGSGGIATCDSCGMEHSNDRMKEKVQEVKGEVTVSNIADASSLMKCGQYALEDSDWELAGGYFDQILDIDLDNAQAYVGKLCVELQLCKEDELATYGKEYNNNVNHKKAIRFADDNYKSVLEGYDRANQDLLFAGSEKLKLVRENAVKHQGCIAQMQDLRFTVGLRKDGTVAITGAVETDGKIGGSYIHGRYGVGMDGYIRVKEAVSNWHNIVAISGDSKLVVGIRNDGWVEVAYSDSGLTEDGRNCLRNLSNRLLNWQNIVSIDFCIGVAVGVTSSGTVVTTDYKYDTSDLKDIVFAFKYYNSVEGSIVGLKSNGTVVATDPEVNELVATWRDIVAISTKRSDIVAIRAGGTLVTSSKNEEFQGRIVKLRDVVAFGTGYYGNEFVVRADGTVVNIGWSNSDPRHKISGWRNIVAVNSSLYNTIGLKKNGTVVAVGENQNGECNVSGWRNIGSVDKELLLKQAEEERQRQAEKQRKEEERRRREREQLRLEDRKRTEQSNQWVQQGLCRYCGGQIGGLFTKKCKSCGNAG